MEFLEELNEKKNHLKKKKTILLKFIKIERVINKILSV